VSERVSAFHPRTFGNVASDCMSSPAGGSRLRYTSFSSMVNPWPATSMRSMRVSGAVSSMSTLVPVPMCQGASRTEYMRSCSVISCPITASS